ncbi:hypothetical protein [Phormidium tenue]|uniref:Uncharacterized protein n=1 Tax=Phormidium tenue NIES-30 TaxID=549789 RepID=A0A1U7J8Y2_9CYAN|nr:hypothetical protein [Phormidium tenue]MBD2231001.1 hypothetical protein [Phormidium tenue FACHB-1052]OKH49963.1 hypothetical protein NIES30_04440 [Phormidium tenue NIES-30]
MASPAALDDAIAALNNRLKAARLGLQVERRGDRLKLWGTLPPRQHQNSAPTAAHSPHAARYPSRTQAD